MRVVIRDKRVAMTSTSDLPRGSPALSPTRWSLLDVAQADPFAGPADPSLYAKLPHPEPTFTILGRHHHGRASHRSRLPREEAAAREADPRITNSEGATFSRSAGAPGIVLGGLHRRLRHLVLLARRHPCRRRRGRQEAPRLPLDGQAATPRRAGRQALEEVGKEATRRTVRASSAPARSPPARPPSSSIPTPPARSSASSPVVMRRLIWRKSSYLARCRHPPSPAISSPSSTTRSSSAPGRAPSTARASPPASTRSSDRGRHARTYLCDSYSARKLSRESTGNALRGAAAAPGPSTTNFVLRPTTTPAAEIVKSTKSGLYVTEMMGFGFNAVTGDFLCAAPPASDRKRRARLPRERGHHLPQPRPVLQRIDAVGGDDLDLRTSTASPTLRVSAMTIAGS
ncbi:MAG: TldD/PmbA family protein [Polyangiaceae bacterium]